MVKVEELQQWLVRQPDHALVGITYGGLGLRAVLDGELPGGYLEVGSIPEEIEFPWIKSADEC